jgi:hypothetical protein
MTDEKLSELEAVCNAAADQDGIVRVPARDVLEMVSELRELRRHAADLSAHHGAIANLHRILSNLSAYGEQADDIGMTVVNRIKVQDPGR